MKLYWIYQYLLLHWTALAICESYYSIIAPGTLKSNRKYKVAVSLHDATAPSTIRISILGPSYNVSEEVNLQPFESKFVEFLPHKLENGDYKLIAEGLTGFQFKNQSELYVNTGSGPKIYIQTDKAIYKPRDLVRFRIVILDEHTRPLNILEPIRVEILDNAKNRVKQFKDISLTKGVYTGDFLLSEQPVLGTWTIDVIISGKYSHSKSKTIQVKKYVLPKFSVHIKAPADILLRDGHIKAAIYGKYTFDKYVEGNATINLRNNKLIEQKTLDIDGLGYVEFNIENLKGMNNLNTLSLEAKITEKFTGKTERHTTRIAVHHQTYDINIPYDQIEFKGNKPYRLKAYVKYWSGAEVLDRNTPIVMEHGNRKYEEYLDDKGAASFEFEHQTNDAHKFTYKDSKATLGNIYTLNDRKDTNLKFYCKLTLVGKGLRLGDPVEILVSSVENIPYLVYTLVGHASLIKMEQIKVPQNQKNYTITIIPSIEMIPDAYLYVHYIRNGNLEYSEMKLSFPEELENQISITAPRQAKPGQEVTIKLNAQPNSYVSILAVDLSVFLLDSSYDLYKDRILIDLKYDLTYTPLPATEYPGLVSGLITLTNAHFAYSLYTGATGPGGAGSDGPRFRTKFPETWIFQNVEINSTNTKLTLIIPETITTWRITAFSNNDITGFGIVDGPTDITTILPFFINLNLPYSVKKGEIVSIPIVIFNYHNQMLDTEVIMYNNDQEFTFMETAEKSSDKQQQQIKQIKVPSDGGKTIAFLIKPQKIGEIKLSISATNSLYSDAIQQNLSVEPAGVPKYLNQALYLSPQANKTLSSSFAIEIPSDSVQDSEIITLSVGGDYLAPSLENLNDLVKMPTGCGEQNMVNFVPNILILQYLKATGKYNQQKELVQKAKSYIEIGYQQELSFRHKNGGYSVFGENSDKEASTWLTAYVIRSFMKASKYTSIEARIIDSGLEYLAQKQFDSGEFPYTGYLFDSAHQNQYGFTAFVLLTFMENDKYSMKYQKTIEKGLKYLNTNLDQINDIYALSITAATFQMANDDNATKVLEKLRMHSKNDDYGNMWWSELDGNQAKDVEITAYALIALLDTPGDYVSVLRWLLKQRNAQGGFKSTHDTVVGLQALIKFSEKHNNIGDMDLKIKYSAKDKDERELTTDEFVLQPDNFLMLQKHTLPKSTRLANIELSGTGNSLVQLYSRFNIANDEEFKHFLIQPKATTLNSKQLNLKVCFTYQSKLKISNSTNMVIMEANLPSGFRSDAESNEDLKDNDFVQRIEEKNDESTIILYFEKLSIYNTHCVNIAADKTTDVMQLKPAAIKMYDYYNTNRTNTVFYNIDE